MRTVYILNICSVYDSILITDGSLQFSSSVSTEISWSIREINASNPKD